MEDQDMLYKAFMDAESVSEENLLDIISEESVDDFDNLIDQSVGGVFEYIGSIDDEDEEAEIKIASYVGSLIARSFIAGFYYSSLHTVETSQPNYDEGSNYTPNFNTEGPSEESILINLTETEKIRLIKALAGEEGISLRFLG